MHVQPPEGITQRDYVILECFCLCMLFSKPCKPERMVLATPKCAFDRQVGSTTELEQPKIALRTRVMGLKHRFDKESGGGFL